MRPDNVDPTHSAASPKFLATKSRTRKISAPLCPGNDLLVFMYMPLLKGWHAYHTVRRKLRKEQPTNPVLWDKKKNGPQKLFLFPYNIVEAIFKNSAISYFSIMKTSNNNKFLKSLISNLYFIYTTNYNEFEKNRRISIKIFHLFIIIVVGLWSRLRADRRIEWMNQKRERRGA